MPANLKISQLPLAGPVAGPELVEVLQGSPSTNKQTTAGNIIGTVVTTTSVGGNNNTGLPLTGTLANQFAYGYLSIISNLNITFMGNGPSNNWTANGTGEVVTSQDVNTNGATNGLCCRLSIYTSAAAAGSAAELYDSSASTAGNMQWGFVPHCINGLPVAGFTHTVYFVLTATAPTQQLYFGFNQFNNNLSMGTTAPSITGPMIGLGKDASDTTLQWMISQNNSTALKTPLAGATPASLQGHYLRLYITNDGVGNVTMTLTDLEPNAAGNPSNTWTVSFAAGNSRLPPGQSGSANPLNLRYHVDNGSTPGAVGFGINFSVSTAGLMVT